MDRHHVYSRAYKRRLEPRPHILDYLGCECTFLGKPDRNVWIHAETCPRTSGRARPFVGKTLQQMRQRETISKVVEKMLFHPNSHNRHNRAEQNQKQNEELVLHKLYV